MIYLNVLPARAAFRRRNNKRTSGLRRRLQKSLERLTGRSVIRLPYLIISETFLIYLLLYLLLYILIYLLLSQNE